MTETEYLELKRKAVRKFFQRMNAPQFEAVTTIEGAVLVLAGAGSGKTTVIVNRIANMVLFGDTCHHLTPIPEHPERLQEYLDGKPINIDELQKLLAFRPVQPWQILAITFTNKAAGELKNRLTDTLGQNATMIHAATFHSACVRMLRTCIDRLGFHADFTIYDTDDSIRAIKAVMKEIDVSEKNFNPKSVLAEMSSAKNAMLSPEMYAEQVEFDYKKKTIAKIYGEYQKRLKSANALDFDDIIYFMVQILEENPDILEKFQNKYRYILVDEYQDTNHAQYRLVSLLARKHCNLCVVGDDDQSIYSFRGATIENILQFEDQFQECKTIRLEENYRSTQNILNSANAVISNNQQRKKKTLWTSAGEGDKIQLVNPPDEHQEGEFIAEIIEKGIEEGKQYSDFAVLYRMNALSNNVERAMIRHHIPYKVYGGIRFLDRKEVRDVLAYLCILSNPNDSVRFERIINVPKRGIGEGTASTIIQIANDLDMSPMDVVRSCQSFPAISKRAGALLQFADIMDELETQMQNLPMEEFFDLLIEKTGYMDMLEEDKEENADRIDNVKEFRSNIVRYTKEHENPTLQEFLEETELYTDADRIQTENTVSLMSMHSAKGLEFDTVFAIGMEDNVFPSSRSLSDISQMEEERRLAYVTITRAKNHLYLLHARARLLYGYTRANEISTFIDEIPQELLFDVTKSQRSQMKAVKGSNSKVSPMRQQMDAIKKQNAGTQAQNAGNPLTFAVGERIQDKVFGEGTILRAEPMAGDYLLEIAFDTVGTKKLMAKYRQLKKI
ncbi:MAG: UvrD-helicase domain-containing protein [Oscillospiraceae bacterium]